MIDLGRSLDSLDAADHVQAGRAATDAGPRSGMERRSIDVLDLVLGILHGQIVRIAVARIDPEAGRDHLVRSQRGDDVLHHFPLAQAELARAHAVDVQLQSGIIEILRDEDVGHAADFADLAREIESQFVVALKIRTR